MNCYRRAPHLSRQLPCTIAQKLSALIDQHGWHSAFDEALRLTAALNVSGLANLHLLEDYFDYLDRLVEWAPREECNSLMVHDKMVEFYFVLDQPPLRALQSPVVPGQAALGVTPLSQWIVDFASAWGQFLDTTDSAKHIDSFRANPKFRWDDYMAPPSGYLTFNQFFARHVKPGRRPIADADSDSVVVSPADAVFKGKWSISASSELHDEKLTLKGLSWSIAELLSGSRFSDSFAGGTFVHVGLRTYDYHRFHSPVAGKVLEVLKIQGNAYQDVTVEGIADDGGSKLSAVEGMGYQFSQARGVLILDSPIGLVACIPVGMSHVSSVVFTAEVDVELRKGDELGYFQFGGSDIVMLFPQGVEPTSLVKDDTHLLQGEALLVL